MGRILWVAAVAIMLVVSGLTLAEFGTDTDLATIAGLRSDDAVLGAPHKGDQARYNVTIQDHTDGDESNSEYTETWRDIDIRLPTGDTRTLPGQEINYEPDESGAGDNANETQAAHTNPIQHILPNFLNPDPRTPSQLAGTDPISQIQRLDKESSHQFSFDVLENRYAYAYTNLSDHEAEAITYTIGTTSTFTWAGNTDESKSWLNGTYLLDYEDDTCPGTLEAILHGLTADQAEDKIRECIDQALEDETNVTLDRLETRWDSSDMFDDVWLLELAITYQSDRVNLTTTETLTTSPQASLLVATESHTTGVVGDQRIDATTTLRLEHWTAGDAPLDTAQEPLPAMPKIPLTEWDASGPAEGDLSLFPVDDAKAAIERTQEGASYFQEADNPWIASATFVSQDRDTNDILATTGGSYNVNGVRCDEEASTPAQELPEETGRNYWSINWLSEDSGLLWGITEEPRFAHENPSGEGLPLQESQAFRSEAPFEGVLEFVPPDTGPQPQALWEQRTLTDAFQDRGAYTASFSGVLLALSEDEARHIDGNVGRVWCEQQDDGSAYEVASIAFDEGTANGVYTSQSWSTQTSSGITIPPQTPPTALGPQDGLC